MKDFVVDNILGNFDVEILLGRADVDQFCFHILLSRLAMRKEGLEPSRCYPLDPKSSASANSATFAYPKTRIYLILRMLRAAVNRVDGVHCGHGPCCKHSDAVSGLSDRRCIRSRHYSRFR